LVENKVISFAAIAYVLGMSNKKLSRWYKHVLSGYPEAKSNGDIFKHDHRPRGSQRKIRVPILEVNNLGREVAIDEKHIRGIYHTIISDNKTGRIILMARSTKASELCSIINNHLPLDKRMAVKVVTKDGASAYDWVARTMFPNATKILDKFHVLKWAFDGLQSTRIQFKNEHIIAEQKKKDELNRQYQIDKNVAKRNGTKISKYDYKYVEEKHVNGDTTKELLTRSKYLLYKYEDQWNPVQEERAQILFDTYPKLFNYYIAILEFRTWYSADDIGSNTSIKKLKLNDWIQKVREFKNEHMTALTITIKKNSGQIANYFIEGYTNATAEALNRNIKRFIGVNYGIRDLNYFYFRLNLLNNSTL